MELGFWVENIRNLVFKLKKSSFWIKATQLAVDKAVLVILLLVVAYYTAPFFFSPEPLNIPYWIGRVFDRILPKDLWNGESIPRNLILSLLFWVFLGLGIPMVLRPKLGIWLCVLAIRLGILIFAATVGLFSTVFFVPEIEHLIKGIGELYGEPLFSDQSSEKTLSDFELILFYLLCLCQYSWFYGFSEHTTFIGRLKNPNNKWKRLSMRVKQVHMTTYSLLGYS